jgi:hypothetical protein
MYLYICVCVCVCVYTTYMYKNDVNMTSIISESNYLCSPLQLFYLIPRAHKFVCMYVCMYVCMNKYKRYMVYILSITFTCKM